MLSSSGPDDRFRGDRPRDPRSASGRPGAAAATGGRQARGSASKRPRGESGSERRRPAGRRGGRAKAGPSETIVPVRRTLSIAVAGFSVLLAFGLVIGSQATQVGFSVVIFSAQALFVLAWTSASRPPSPWVVATVGLFTAAASDVAVNFPVRASMVPLGYVVAGAFVAAVVGQLALRGGRAGVTESLGVTMVVVVGVAAFAAFLVLSRQPLGDQVLLAGVGGAGVGLAAARICDVIAPNPRITPAVPRGSTGVIVGAMTGTAVGAIAGYLVDGLSTFEGAIAGMVAVLVAVVVDLGTGYAEAGRRLQGEPPFMWLSRHMQGPLGALAFAAPAAYVVGVILR